MNERRIQASPGVRLFRIIWVLVLALLAGEAAAGWYDPGWPYRQKTSIQPTLTDSTLSDYPFLVKITDAANPVFTRAQPDGDDLLFTDSTGTLKLNHEIEKYDSSAKELLVWVRVPSISATNPTVIYLYYGHGTTSNQENIPGTWDDDFVMVQHLEETSGTHFDSTGTNNGNPLGGLNQNATGKVDGADLFDGTDDYIDVADHTTLQVVEMTLEAWVYMPVSIPAGFRGIVEHTAGSANWYGLWKADAGDTFHFRWSTGAVRRTDFNGTIVADDWYHVVGVLDPGATEARTYLNGNPDKTVSDPSLPTPTAGSTRIGLGGDGDPEWFDGTIDEVRISKIARTADWIEATFRNLDDPATYQTLDPEQEGAALKTISGIVYEDVDGDGGLGDAVGAAGVRVRLYADVNDDGAVDSGDTFVKEVSTAATGDYSFDVDTGASGTKFLVAVDSKTVPPNGASPFRAGFTQADVWAEQTYGDDPATGPLDLGPRIGGITPGTSDDVDPSSTLPADNQYQHLARVDVSGGDVSVVHFALSFLVVSHPADRDDDLAENRTAQGSLRQGVQNTNAIAGAATLDVPAEAYSLSLTGSEDAALSADLDLLDEVTISGAGSATTIVDGAGLERVFDILAGADATITAMTIRNGTPGGVVGGGIRNVAALTLTDAVVTANLGDDNGGGIYSEGAGSSLVLDNVTVSDNTADRGGGIYVLDSAGAFSLTDVTISGNTVTTEGGGLRIESASGPVTLTRTTISGNSAPKGGGLHFKSSGTAILENVTISGNSVTGEGGGIRDEGFALTLTNVTVADNTAPAGKGAGLQTRSGTITMKNSIVADNTGGDCKDSVTSAGYNLDSDGSCGLGGTGDISSGNADLDVLADNGGPTQTHALLSLSDAIDAVLAGCPPPATDQRGNGRPTGGACEMGAFEVPGPLSYAISGTVFEDADFAGTASDYDGGASDLGLPAVDVELYDATDTHVRSVTTDGDGDFAIYAPDGTYKLRVRSATIGDDPGGPDETAPRGGFDDCVPATCAEPLPEMTWGAGSALYGGQDPEADDTVTAAEDGPGDTWVSVTVDGGAVSGVNFGFAYNLIVNTDDDTNADNVRSKQGSLRQFLKNANSIGAAGGTTASSSEFRIPTSDPNYDAGTGVFGITLPAALPPIGDAGTTLDGSTQTANVGNTNTAVLGAGGTVGVDDLPLSQVAGPELEIVDGAGLANGILIQADGAAVRGLSIYGFGADNGEAAIRIDSGATGATIENNVLGSTASSFSDPGAGQRNYEGVDADGASGGTIHDNLIGFSARRGIFLQNSSAGWTVEGNEIRDSGLTEADGDGVSIDQGTADFTGNLIAGSSSQALAVTNASGNTFTNNTITGNGVGTASSVLQSAGITMRSTAGSALLDRNVIQGNYGAGIQVNDEAAGTRLTRNSFADNGTIDARNGDPPTGQIGIDLNSPSDDSNLGTAPFTTLNDSGDGDAGGNDLLNYPILEMAEIVGTDLTIEGWARPGSVIELFVAAEDPSGFGEGQTWVISVTEGGTGSGGDDPYADQDAGSGLYGPGAINGLLQGTDTTNRYRFTMPTPAAVADGTKLTATATNGGGSTSEFSGIVTAVELTAITGTVFEDTAGDLLADGPIGGANNPGLQSVSVWLYADDGTTAGQPDGDDTLLPGPLATDADGDYVFTVASDGTYWVVVDSGAIVPAAGLNPSWAVTDAWAEQSYGPEGAVGFSGSYTFLGAAGAMYGGKQATVSDDAPAGLLASEHVARVVVDGASVSDVDFGFSFNIVTNVAAPDSGQNCCRSVQGSFDQFVQNASVVDGPNTMRFVPAVPTNASGGGGSWWRIQHVLPVSSRFQFFDFDTIIDGTAYDSADGVTVLDTNPGYLGLNAAGGVEVGVDEVALPQVAKPELEVFGRGFSPSFRSSAGTQADRSEIRDLSAWGVIAIFSSNGAIVPAVTLMDLRYENNVIGAPPDAFADPGAGVNPSSCISFDSASSGHIVDNLIGFCDHSLIEGTRASGWTITGNELRDGGVAGAPYDAVRLGRATGSSTADTFTIEANHIEGHPSNGIDSAQGGGHTMRNNTVVGHGSGGVETAGIRLATDGNLVDRNVIQTNTSAGVLVVGQDGGFPDSPGQQNQVTANHFGGNGGPGIDLVAQGGDPGLGDGPTANAQVPPNCGYDNNGGNRLIDTPIIDTADLVGPTTTVTGRACANSTVELYRMLGDEGDLYLGSAATDGSGDFSTAVTGLVLGDSVIAIVRDASGDTSEFSGSLGLTEILSITGTVFEDIVGDVLDDGVVGDVNNPGIPSVDVYLYDDTNGNGAPDAGEPLTTGVTNPAVTDASGAYAFSPLPAGNYLVVVDSRSVDPTQTFVASPVHWAEQTYGPAGALCADWVAGTVTRGTAGPCYGGRRGAVFDDLASGVEDAEHVVAVTVAGSSTDNDLGFSFNVVTNLDGTRDGVWSVYTGQGTADMFLRNATAITVPNTMRFVPAVPANMTGAVFGGQWWRIDVDGFSNLFLVDDSDTIVDGTAHDPADGITVLDTNPGFMGANAAGGLTVGLDSVALPQVERPELELRGGITVWTDGHRAIIQDMAFTEGTSLISVYAAEGAIIRRNVLGSEPDDFVEPAGTSTSGVHIRDGGFDGFIEDNLIGFCHNGVQLGTLAKAATGWQITGNEIRDCTDGVEAWELSPTNTVQDNLLAGNWRGVLDRAGSNAVTSNTTTASGMHGVVLAGSSTSVTRNIIENGLDPVDGDPVNAVLVVGDETPGYPNSPARLNRISDNRFGGNSWIAIDLAASGTGTAGDGVTPNDGGTDATHGHNKLDHPVIDSALLSGPTADISGTACLNCTVEIYRAVADGDGSDTYLGVDYGEGIELVATTSADGAGDFSATGVTGLSGGDYVSAIALTTAAGPADTSEFGPNVLVAAPAKITGMVYHDANDSGALDPGELGIGNVWVKLVQGGSVLQVVQADQDTGVYELLNVAAGNYDVVVDDNSDGADSTPNAPVNWLFATPATGLLSVAVAAVDVPDQDFGLTFDFDLAADCACGYEDGLFTQVSITVDGDMSDWGAVFSDGDNNACDATDDTDRDHPVQSTGRNLLRTAVTWDATYFSMWTQRVGQSNNTQNFVYYADTNADGIQQNGEPVVVARWQGNTGNVTLELYTYDDLDSGGDPMLDANGFADGYSMPGDLTLVKTLNMPDGSGQGSTTGNTDGTQMEWTIAWTELGVPAGSAIGWHVGSTNSNPGAAGLGAQIDDNLGGCGGQCTGSNQFAGVTPTPIGGNGGQTVYASHTFTNTGNGADLFDLTWVWTGDFAPAGVSFYEDLGTIGQFDPGVDTLLTDTDGDSDPDTGNLAAGASFELLIAIELPGPPATGVTTVTAVATSNFVPGCGGTAIPVSGSVDDPAKIVPRIVKRAFQVDGSPIASGSTLPSGTPVKFMIYIANYGAALTDVSLRDVLEAEFAYQAGSMQVDNTLAASVVCPAGVCDEATIFSQVDGSGAAVGDGDSVTAPLDADEASYNDGTRTVDLGDQNNPNNAQSDVAADSVWALVFTVRM